MKNKKWAYKVEIISEYHSFYLHLPVAHIIFIQQ